MNARRREDLPPSSGLNPKVRIDSLAFGYRTRRWRSGGDRIGIDSLTDAAPWNRRGGSCAAGTARAE